MNQAIPECRHIKTDGRKCHAIAQRGELYCYYHHPKRLRAARAVTPRYFLELPSLEHRGAVRAAIAEIYRALISREIDVKLAGNLIYALQLATSEKKGTPIVQQSSPRYLKIAPLPGFKKISPRSAHRSSQSIASRLSQFQQTRKLTRNRPIFNNLRSIPATH